MPRKREEIEHSNRVFFKVAYQTILKNPDDPDIVSMAISTMNHLNLDYDHLLELQEFGVKHYFYHDKPLGRCANCDKGDDIARMIHFMTPLYFTRDQPEKGVELGLRVLRERGSEISPWVKAELYGGIARSYKEMGELDKAIDFLGDKISELESDIQSKDMERWIADLKTQLAHYKEKVEIKQSLKRRKEEGRKKSLLKLAQKSLLEAAKASDNKKI